MFYRIISQGYFRQAYGPNHARPKQQAKVIFLHYQQVHRIAHLNPSRIHAHQKTLLCVTCTSYKTKT